MRRCVQRRPPSFGTCYISPGTFYHLQHDASPLSCTDPHPGSIPVLREVIVHRLRHPYMIVNARKAGLMGRQKEEKEGLIRERGAKTPIL